jgi:hypothetical protein
LCLIEEEEIGASANQDANTDDDHREVDEDQWGLHYAQHHHYHREDGICHQHKPKHLGSCQAHIFLIGPALEHKLLSPIFVILEEPSHPNHLLPRYVLGEPEINYHKDSYEFVHDQLAEDSRENSLEDEEADHYGLEDCVDNEADDRTGWLDVCLLLLQLLLL